MFTLPTLLATSQATPAEASFNWTVLLAIVTSTAFGTVAVAIVRGLWVRAQLRAPRARVEAIRSGAETLKLLQPGSAPFIAVQRQVLAEAEALKTIYIPTPVSARTVDESMLSFDIPYREYANTLEKRLHLAKVWSRWLAGAVVLAFAGATVALVFGSSTSQGFTLAVLCGMAGGVFLMVAIIMHRAGRMGDAVEAQEAETSSESGILRS